MDESTEQLLQNIEKAIEALSGGSQQNTVLNLQELAGNPTNCAKV